MDGHLSTEGHSSSIQSSYTDQFAMLQQRNEYGVFFRDLRTHLRIPGAEVVDLAAGQGDVVRAFCIEEEARYVGVDVISRKNPGPEFKEVDITEYLETRLPSAKSCNFAVSGLEDNVTRGGPMNWKDLINLMHMHMQPQDYIFGVRAPELCEALASDQRFEAVVPYNANRSQLYAYRMK